MYYTRHVHRSCMYRHPGRGCRGGGNGAVRARTTPVKNILYTPLPAAYNAYTHRKDDDDNNNDILYP